MSQFIEGDYLTGKAGENLSGLRYHFVEERTADTFHQASQTTAITAGILQNKPQNGEHARVKFQGVSKVYAGGTITANALFTNNASGAAAVVTSGTIIKGRARSAVASGGIFEGIIYSGGLQTTLSVVNSAVV